MINKILDPLFIIIDLFCGFGGTTSGFVKAKVKTESISDLVLSALTSSKDGGSIAENYLQDFYELCKVIACVNHDPKAIKSHWLNHPEVKHFEEDIRTLDLTGLIELVDHYRKLYPHAKLILWASLECTNFSKAKGGQPRDADSRTLAEHLYRYIRAVSPDYIQIENVVEFMSWGPLDENGKPVSKKNGQYFMNWRNEICGFGYTDDWRELNSANFGAYTSRNRLFGCFAKKGLPILWPQPTHAKKDPTGQLKKWMPVKEVLNFQDEGESIFTRKKPLSNKTLERIYAGLIKYVAKGDTSFISKYYSGRPAGKVIPTTGPTGVLTTTAGQSLVQTSFIAQRNSGEPESKLVDLDGPARTITKTGGNQDLVQPKFLTLNYSGGGQLGSIENPCPTLPCKDKVSIVQPDFLINYNHSSTTNDINETGPCLTASDKLGKAKVVRFIDKHYGNAQNQSIDQPAGSLMPNDKHRLVQCDGIDSFIMDTQFNNGPKSIEDPHGVITANRKHSYIVNPSHGGHCTSTEVPCPVIVARQDKAPLYCVQAVHGKIIIPIYDTDSEIMIKIKEFMIAYELVDIKMRMLRVPELLKIQGFPEYYKMEGNQSDQKKFIGNSVHPMIPEAWIKALAQPFLDPEKFHTFKTEKITHHIPENLDDNRFTQMSIFQ